MGEVKKNPFPNTPTGYTSLTAWLEGVKGNWTNRDMNLEDGNGEQEHLLSGWI